MKQLSRVTFVFAVLLAAFAGPAFSQAPPTELEGSWSPLDTAIELRWHAPEVLPAPTHYNVYKKTDGSPSFELLTTAPDRRYDDAAVVAGTTYLYTVTAVYAATGESTPTNTVAVTAGGDSIPGGGGQGSLPPRDLVGTFDNRGVVELDWLWPDSGHSPLSYNVYRALSADSVFAPLANVPEEEHDDSLISANTGYLYYVRALYAGAVESIPSNTVFVQTGSLNDTTGDDSSGVIHFSSQPVLSGMVGEPYQYQATVVTTPPGLSVCYELNHAPAGMTVDANGLLAWLPGTIGVFEVELKARICPDGEGAEQKFRLMVLSAAAASIHGIVIDTSGAPLDSIRIKIFDVSTGMFVLKTRTDSAGYYAFPIVNPGTYFVRADADETPFEDVWYVNSRELAGATPVVVGESSDVAVNFTLSREHDEPSVEHAVSGAVRDTTGAPIAGASVSLIKLSREYDGDDDFFDDDSDHDGHHGDDDPERNAVTDSNGTFQIIAHDGDYLVRAKARGFFEQYWDGQPSPLEARILALHADTGNIDFTLVPKAPGLEGPGSISGTVRRADNLAPLRAEVVGFMKNSAGHLTGLIASDHTDSNGAYTLDELPAGFYLVMVKDEDGIIPTFYSTSGGTPFADSASLVAVATSAVAGIDIDALIDTAEGLNDISGEVDVEVETPGKTAYRAPGAIGPLAGAIVAVVDGAGRIVGSAVTGPDGMYTTHGLAPGDYTVLFQKPGVVTLAFPATVAYQGGLPATTTLNASLTAESGPAGVTLFGVSAGWNLVSVPMAVADYAPSAIFPTASSSAYAYSGSYNAVTATEHGRGYWLKFPSGQVLSAAGSEIGAASVPLAKGWNIIGPLSAPVSAASIATTPPGLVVSELYGYDGGYTASATLQPGKGYWVKSAGAGVIDFAGASSGATSTGAPGIETNGAPGVFDIEFSDELGNRQILSVGPGMVEESLRELPPVPPAGAFDVRFATGGRAVTLGTGTLTRSYMIRLQPAGERTRALLPARLNGDADGLVFSLSDASGKTIAVSSAGPVVADLGRAAELTLTVSPGGRPREYRLEQNYPNPFNPATTIAWQLPADSRVALKVYNSLGQLVGTLVDGEMPAGVHSINWEAGGHASGVYFVRIEAASATDPGTGFTRTMKMLLMR